MIRVPIDFERFPWFNGERRPVHIKGTALCRLVKLTEPTSFGDPCHVTWVIDRVECTISDSAKTMVDFNQNAADLEDFRRWLAGHHGYMISAQLRSLAQQLAAETETETTE